MSKGRAALVGVLVVALLIGWAAVVVRPLLSRIGEATPPTQAPSPGANGSSAGQASPGTEPSSAGQASPDARPTWPGYASPDRQTAITSDAKPAGFADPPPGSGIQRYLNQQLVWKECGNKHQCADVLVPLDWSRPDGQAITLSMLKVASKVGGFGPLFLNPGGPGGSAKDYADRYISDTYPGYDIVGLDPRGSGDSTSVVCGTTEQTDTYFETDNSPDDDAEYAAYVAAAQEFARQCRQASGPLLDHVTTIDHARDLDFVRQLLGASKLNYLGVSYGTYIGSVYAEFFPNNVGRLVLDSAVNITDDDSVIQAQGFDLTFGKFVSWCVGKGGCPFGATEEAARNAIVDFVNGLDAKPIKSGKRTLTQTLAATGIAVFLYGDEAGYPYLRDTIKAAMDGKPQRMIAAADALNARNAKGSYDSMAFAFPGIACADHADKGLAEARARWASDRAKAPIFGFWFGPSVGCEVWTAKPAPQYKLVGKGAAPIVVVGSTGDSATPYQQAVAMAKQLDSAVLVTYDGVGHGAVSSGNSCITTAVTDYLVKGTVPADGLTCK